MSITSAVGGRYLAQFGYNSETIRLSQLLDEVPFFRGQLKYEFQDERYHIYMNAGTELRERTARGDAMAMLSLGAIRDRRQAIGGHPTKSKPRSAFILRSLKHPKEVE